MIPAIADSMALKLFNATFRTFKIDYGKCTLMSSSDICLRLIVSRFRMMCF